MRNNNSSFSELLRVLFFFPMYFTFSIQVLCKASDVLSHPMLTTLREPLFSFYRCPSNLVTRLKVKKSESVAELGLLCLADPPLLIPALVARPEAPWGGC